MNSLKTYERVFSTRGSGEYIAIPLSKSIQNKIIKEANLDDNSETEKYLK